MEIQTRSDNPEGKYGGLHFFQSLKEAYAAAKVDSSIWKISYSDQKGRHRWVREENGWSDEPMQITGSTVTASSQQKMTDEEFAKFADSR